MQSSFFTKKPTNNLRLEIDRVIMQFRGGIHRSAMTGLGFEFKSIRPYDPSDSPTAIDWLVSARMSEDPELEPYSRTYHPEKEIVILVLLDINDSMYFPPKKQEQAQDLVWLFALSAFRYNDRFRIMLFRQGELFDSLWVNNEDSLEQFLGSQNSFRVVDHRQTFADVFMYIATLNLHNTIIVFVSDFCTEWKEEPKTIRHLDVYGNNIRTIFLALDEWRGFTPARYGVTLRDPEDGTVQQYDLRKNSDFEQMAKKAEEKFSQVAKSVKSLSIPLIRIPLLEDPIKIVRKEFLKLGFE